MIKVEELQHINKTSIAETDFNYTVLPDWETASK